MELEIGMVDFDGEESFVFTHVLEGIREVCGKLNLIEINGSSGPHSYSCLFTDNKPRPHIMMKLLRVKRNQINRQIAALKKATLKNKGVKKTGGDY